MAILVFLTYWMTNRSHVIINWPGRRSHRKIQLWSYLLPEAILVSLILPRFYVSRTHLQRPKNWHVTAPVQIGDIALYNRDNQIVVFHMAGLSSNTSLYQITIGSSSGSPNYCVNSTVNLASRTLTCVLIYAPNNPLFQFSMGGILANVIATYGAWHLSSVIFDMCQYIYQF